ncbi:plakophilin-1 [Labrus mixtus]|uniref:plakophilin-1 n=1 Tax=Labrus mixtus TaxID=508554 RepID=UPI0029C01F34|nr:plakophilin-1 [Labrus mixtus]
MTSLDPLKSAISIHNVDDTSLALPSVNQFNSGQQRVLEQVQTLQRTKRNSSNRSGGSTSLSPTSPVYDTVFVDGSRTSAANGGVFFGNGYSKALSLEKNINRQVVNNQTRSTLKKNTAASNYHYDKSLGAGKNTTSRSEPDLAWQRSMPKRSGASQILLSNMSTRRIERSVSQFTKGSTSQSQLQPQIQSHSQAQIQTHYQPQIQSHSQAQIQTHYQPQIQSHSQAQIQTHYQPQMQTHSQPRFQSHSQSQIQSHSQAQIQSPTQPQPVFGVVNGTGLTKTNTQFVNTKVETFKTLPKTQVDSGSTGNSGTADITIKEAVEYLSNSDETYQHCGASFIQHNTFIDDKAKDEVLKLSGIPPLVGLLRSPSVQVNQTASAALRNLSFKSNPNKEEMHRCGGITEAVALLRETDSVEIQKQLTGLLWNLSSVDSLKPDLLKSALPVLMERVILPYTTGPDQSNSDPEVFYHATACLRNISSAKQNNRQAMRKCRGLVDSLVSYVGDCVDAGRPDDKSLENCVCILHNLTFQLEDEAPALFSRLTALAKNVNRSQSMGDSSPIGCFSPQSKSPEQERHFDFPVVEEPQPNGAGWLIHSQTLQSYLSLLATSQQEETQEACCGAMQNLTTQEGIVSSVMSQIIVQKLNGLKVISPLLKSNKVNLQRNAVALVGNLTKNPNLKNTLARKALPELLSIVNGGTKGGNESDDTLSMACRTANYLLMKDPEMGKHLLNHKLIKSLNEISQNEYFPKSKKAAALLLYNLWSEKDLQSFLKKQGMTKASFVNDITTAAQKSIQIVD